MSKATGLSRVTINKYLSELPAMLPAPAIPEESGVQKAEGNVQGVQSVQNVQMYTVQNGVQMDVQLYTEMYNNLYTPHTNETAGSTAEQAENGDVQNLSRPKNIDDRYKNTSTSTAIADGEGATDSGIPTREEVRSHFAEMGFAVDPDRFFDVGIAESNLMGVAAGIATTGRVAFASTFAMFAAGRAFEQVRNSIGYPHLNVKIGATHGGISVGEDGASHQCCEDFALMRSIPGMTVLCPADDVEAKAAVKAAYEHEGPVYLRFGRLALPVFHDEATFKFEIGKGEQLTEGSDVAIIATGLEVNEALIAAEQLKNEGIQARVINLCTIKPLDEELVVKAAKECGAVVTCEEHSILGGLGEAVAAVLGEQCPIPMRRVGVKDVFGHSGPAWELLEQFGLRSDAIIAAVKELV